MGLADLETLGNKAQTAYKTSYSFSDFKPSKEFREKFKEVYEANNPGSVVTTQSSCASVTTSTDKTFDIPYTLFMRSYYFMDFAIKFKEYSTIAGSVLSAIPQSKWSVISPNELAFKTAIFDALEESKPDLTLPVNKILSEWNKSLTGNNAFIFTDFVRPISDLKSSMGLSDKEVTRLFHFISDRTWSHTGKSPLRMGGLISAVMGLMSVVQAKQGAIEDALQALTLDDDLVDLLNKSVNSSASSTNNETKKLNQILYGPPGTGKTYHTINRAIEILDSEFYADNKDDRAAIKQKFDELKEEGQIGFVTFHQSFSYEDFVEGLRAEANEEDGGINYFVQDGIFKEMCTQARKGIGKNSIDVAIANFIEHVQENPTILKTSTGKSFTVTHRGGRTFRIKPESSSNERDYPANIEDIKKVFRGTISSSQTYNRSYSLGILQHLKSDYNLADENTTTEDKSPVVLIIDEINRGNTASIFGELITLIESSKRSGMEEELNVTLPYSHEKFSVPGNLHIIGTMNTADRSLSHIDTALRRRFVFEEMMPEAELFEGIIVEGIDIQKMLVAINERIEILYDREHTLGHSFFQGLSNESKIGELEHIFDMKVLPLLEEYFFEDWEKIRLVLNDNNKSKETAFIVEKFNEKRLIELLGDEHHEYSQNISFARNQKALSNPDSYINIYSSITTSQD